MEGQRERGEGKEKWRKAGKVDTHGSVGNANEPEKPEEDEGQDLVVEGAGEAGHLQAALDAVEAARGSVVRLNSRGRTYA